MTRAFGKNVPLSLPRRLICDYLHFAQKIPSVPVQRRMNLHDLVTARAALSVRPSWCAIFTKAYGLAARERAPLRRAYLSFPRPHLYEHPINVISVAVERRYGDEDGVFFAPLRQPEEYGLLELEDRLRELKEKPVEQFGSFRRGLYISRLPRPLRRFLWWVGLNVFGRKRAHYLGTAGVTVYAGLGAASLHPLSLLTTTLNYGVIDPDGGVDVRITYDHRVMDGATVARALADLDRVLHTEILGELRGLAGQAAGESHAA